jgi:glycosyltransferase involved in cell wall biosynthesis
MENPLVSIVIPSYNREVLITETLDSLLTQSYTNWEAIIVDDGSTDNSLIVLETYSKKDKRISFFVRDRLPKGAPTCRNLGVEKAKGEFIIFLDSDDILAPYCLNKRLKEFKADPSCDFLVFPMLLFKERPGDTNLLWNVDNEEDDLDRFLRADTPWAITCPIWKKESIKKVGGWDEEVLTWQDWEWHIKSIVLGCKYKVINALPDSFVRRDENERISLGDMAPFRLSARLQLFLKIYDLLLSKERLTKSNKYSLANLLFSHAVKSAIFHYKEPLAEKFSSKIIELKLLPVYSAYLQALYIKLLIMVKLMKLRFVSTLLRHVFYLCLPDYLTKNYSKRDSVHLQVNDFEQVRKMLQQS